MVQLWNLYGTQLQPRMSGFGKISKNLWKEGVLGHYKAEVWNLPDGGRTKEEEEQNREYFAYGPNFVPALSQTTSIEVDYYGLQRTDRNRQRTLHILREDTRNFACNPLI